MNSLSNIAQLDYSSLLAEYDRVMNHLFESSDAFAVVADLKKPYSKLPPNVRQSDFAESLKDYALSQITNERKWYEGVERRGKHKVLLTFRACRQAMEIVREQGNLLAAPANALPEDLCFLRDGRAWFSTITHERMAFVSIESPDDAAFFLPYIKQNA